MCPTVTGRIHTRVATLVGPALLGLLISLITGNFEWVVLIGVLLLLGVALDLGLYSWFLIYQPPWMTFVLAFFEFSLLLLLSGILPFENLSIPGAIVFYWVSWLIAISTKIVLLPIFSLTYLESSGEFRRIAWSIPAQSLALPANFASAQEAAAGPGPVLRSASGVHATPLEKKPSPSGVHAVPPAAGVSS